MKTVRYTADATRALKRHANMAGRLTAAMAEYASASGVRVGQVKVLKGTDLKRLRVGDFRIVFREDASTIIVLKVAPRGNVYE